MLGLGTTLPDATLQPCVSGTATPKPSAYAPLGLARPMAPPAGLAEAALAVSAAPTNKNNDASGHIVNEGRRGLWVSSLSIGCLIGCLPKSRLREALAPPL